MFKESTIEKLGYYVYALVDSRDNKVFYIGKGRGNRIFSHINGIVEFNRKSEKIDLIKEIFATKNKVNHYVIRHGLSEKEAFEVEATLIDFIGLENLTNVVKGQHSDVRGIKTAEELKVQYEPKDVNINESVILININKKFEREMNLSDIYEAVRKSWKISITRAQRCQYVFAVYRGIVREVYTCNSWEFSEIDEKGNRRYEFIGDVASNEIRDKYRLMSVISFWPVGSRNPIKYVNG